MGKESACAGSKRLLSPESVRSEAALSHTGWDLGLLLAVLPVALPCKTGERLGGLAPQVGYGGPCRQASGKETRLSPSAQSVGEGEGIFTLWSLKS